MLDGGEGDGRADALVPSVCVTGREGPKRNGTERTLGTNAIRSIYSSRGTGQRARCSSSAGSSTVSAGGTGSRQEHGLGACGSENRGRLGRGVDQELT